MELDVEKGVCSCHCERSEAISYLDPQFLLGGCLAVAVTVILEQNV